MKKQTIFLLSLLVFIISSCASKFEGKHLFILSGQSNMALLNHEESFTPILKDKFGEENVIVVKDASKALRAVSPSAAGIRIGNH